MNNPKAYIDDHGRMLMVSDGISGGQVWMTCYRKPSGGSKRLTSKHLPLRDTREEAQADLDARAAAMGWREIEPL